MEVTILEIVCVVHVNDIIDERIPHNYTCHCLGGYTHNNMHYPIFVVMEASKDARISKHNALTKRITDES